ncbi:MAG: hypothetical protein ABEJ24_04120 [Candidatus Magasanikbacteria bacterium]
MSKKQKVFHKIDWLLIPIAVFLLLSALATPSSVKSRDVFLKINDQAAETSEVKVKLQLQGPEDVDEMRIAKNDENLEKQKWIEYEEEKDFWLKDDYGEQEVRVQFKQEDGDISRVYSDSILYKPRGKPQIKLDDGAKYTSDREVEIELIPPNDAVQMRIANGNSTIDSEWRNLEREFFWELEDEFGTQKVSVQFKEEDGGVSSLFHDEIYYRKKPSFKINQGANSTESRLVTLNITLPKGYNYYQVSNNRNFSTSRKIKNKKKIKWVLSTEGFYSSVFVKFTDKDLTDTKIVEQTIDLNAPYDMPSGSVVTNQNYGWQPYYLGFDRKLHPFPSTAVFHSWYEDFSKVKTVKKGKLSKFPIGRKVCMKAGTWLVKMESPKIYMPQYGCKLRPIRSKVEANLAYGKNWNKRIVKLDSENLNTTPYFKSNFSAAKPAKGKYDKDQDGVIASRELNYSTSDQKVDSDNDGLTDFEEIYIFNTSPTKADSNNNGISDSGDILAKNSPIFTNQKLKLDNNYFLPPTGLIQQQGFFYRSFGETASVDNKQIKENSLNRNFAIQPQISTPLKINGKLEQDPYISYPTIYGDGQLTFY